MLNNSQSVNQDSVILGTQVLSRDTLAEATCKPFDGLFFVTGMSDGQCIPQWHQCAWAR